MLSPNSSLPPSHSNKQVNPTEDIDSEQKNLKQNPSQLSHIQLSIDGMTCQTCANRIEKVLNKKPAIESVHVNFAGETANVSYYPEQADGEQIITWVNKTGFTAHEFLVEQQFDSILITDNMEDNQSSINKLIQAFKSNWRLWALAICFVPFMIGMLGMLFGQGMAWMIPAWLQFVVATFVQFVLATPFYRSAWESLKGGMANMDVLVVLGTLTIWSYSTFIWLFAFAENLDILVNVTSLIGSKVGEHVYFESGVMIITFVRLGKFLESRTKKHSLNSIDMMLSLTPSIVERQTEFGDFLEADIQEVQIGDVLRAKQGSRIATDGIVLEGDGWCNESHLTGESELLHKQITDVVLAGALVENGSINYRVQAKGSDSKLGDMIQALNEAQGSQAPLARLADKVASVFVPFVMLIAIITALLTYYFTLSIEMAILHSVSVLVVACPCALGLATPAAIMAGMGVAARHGILFQDASSLEQAGQIDTVVMDKTGTLTKGKPSLIAHLLMDKSLNYNDVLQLTASVEAHVSHPFATTLVNSAKHAGINLLTTKNVKVFVGKGVQANVMVKENGQEQNIGLVKVGRADWLNMKLPDDIAKKLPKILKNSSLVAVSIDDIPLALYAFTDELRNEAKNTVKQLQQAGIEVVLMSGDKQEVVDYVATKLEINQAYAQMTPSDKAKGIKTLQAEDRRVAMVGDGVNDAPAMVQADASFAMSEGTDIAQHSASARLMAGSLYQVYEAQQIAKSTVNTIKQNLFLAFVYNCLAIPLAAFGFLNPALAAAMMALSSISVLTNALRLTRYRQRNIISTS